MIRFLKNIAHLIVVLVAAVCYRFPGKSLTVIGVTGTDGKTTTVHLIYEILKSAGKKVSLISTVEALINGKKLDTGLHVTSPSPFALQRLMRQAVKGGSKYLVLEVTSHGLDQHRVFGSSIDIALVNNVSHEHLDYHKTFENYRAAKAKIFRGAKISILNADDNEFSYLKKKAAGKIYTFGIRREANFNLNNLPLKPRIPGQFNLYNCLAAGSVASLLGLDKKIILSAVSQFEGVPGRMEEIKTGKPFKVFIDFAHKPNAMIEALKTARHLTVGKLIVVFGCAGLRDRLKRPMMGKIAAKLADYIILTAEDPRTEDVRDIINQIAEGCFVGGARELNKRDKDTFKHKKQGKNYFWRIPDRQEAINFAIRSLAKKGDLVLFCGKGHEKSMAYGKTEYPWDEKKAVLKALYATV